MDEEYIQINDIHNIETIKFGDFASLSADSTKTSLYNELINNGNDVIVLMLSVSYDASKIIVLTSQDKNFNFLVKKKKSPVKEEFCSSNDSPKPLQ